MKKIALKPLLAITVAVTLAVAALPAYAGKTIDTIKSRGQLACGVNTGLAGFSQADTAGNWSGLDADFCKVLAAVLLNDASKVKWVPLNSQQRLSALQSGEIDVLSRNTTFTLTRDASLGLHITAPLYYDGQGFMVPTKSGIKDVRQLKGQTICVLSGSTTEKNLADFSRANNLGFKPVVFESLDALIGAYFGGRCVGYTTDASGLASVRNKEAKNPNDHVILPTLISKEPLGPMVRRGDDEWFAIVKWVIYGLLEAEEYGITRANVDSMKATSQDPAVQRILGSSEDTGKLLGLDRDWMVRAIKTSGNYGEMFERNLGPKSAIGLPRGLNNQWNQGGLMYADPIR